MPLERTLTIVKPDGVAAGLAGAVLAHLESHGFRIVGLKRLHLSHALAESFYQVHAQRSFFPDLIAFMTEGPVVVAVLERDDAVGELRRQMGATDPAKAAEGTIRRRFATSIERNVIHGSDAAETARHEIAFFFAGAELL